MRKEILLLLLILSVTTPVLAYGALVHCDGVNTPCQACDLVKLGQNIINWLVSIMSILIAIVVAIAGFKMVTSAGNAGQVSEAKGMMTNAIVGFVILLSAWLVVDTIIKTFVNTSLIGVDGTSGKYGVWNQIQCVPQPKIAQPTTPPTVTTGCSVSDLTPITDPYALQMEAMNGNALIWENTNPNLRPCVNKFIGMVGGSPTSAYRPQSYQTHLYEVWSKWCNQGLSTNTTPECSEIKNKVSAEMSKHGLSCAKLVASNNSSHALGTAVDVTGIAHGSPSVRTAADASCLVWFGEDDDVHYTLKSGCTCN